MQLKSNPVQSYHSVVTKALLQNSHEELPEIFRVTSTSIQTSSPSQSKQDRPRVAEFTESTPCHQMCRRLFAASASIPGSRSSFRIGTNPFVADDLPAIKSHRDLLPTDFKKLQLFRTLLSPTFNRLPCELSDDVTATYTHVGLRKGGRNQ